MQGQAYAKQFLGYVKKQNGRFARGDNGSLFLILGNQRIALNYDRTNELLGRVMLAACRATTVTSAAQAAIQRVIVEAAGQTGLLKLRRFSSVSADGKKLYIPLANQKLLRVTADGIGEVPNGENDDAFWVEHPCGEPIKYETVDHNATLADFERLLVETQACQVPEMRWLVAMHEGLFPFVREICPARMILVHLGPTQSGKTSGAQRFTLLHGLGDVKGDYTVAALGNLPDIGLLVLDNREQSNFGQPLVDFCLFLATGAERARSFADGSLRTATARPVGVITSIEGVVKAELRKRCVNVEYSVRPGTLLRRGPIEREVQERRHMMGSALVAVSQRYLQIRGEQRPTPNPIPEFEEHFTALCELLWAFGDVAGKPKGWADSLVQAWGEHLRAREQEEGDLEPLVRRLLEDSQLNSEFPRHKITREGRPGTLFVTEAARLLNSLQRANPREYQLPKSAAGLTRRLRSDKARSFEFVDADSAPDLIPLRRTGQRRPIGFFRADDDMTQYDAAA
ncbi:MAG: hypothetical protein ABFD89_18990 [Bryobacteraceae bacterium]